MDKLFANSGDPDQMPHFAASDLGLHCLLRLVVSRLKRVKVTGYTADLPPQERQRMCTKN